MVFHYIQTSELVHFVSFVYLFVAQYLSLRTLLRSTQPLLTIFRHFKLSRRNDTKTCLVDEMRVGDLRVGEMRIYPTITGV